MSTNYQQSTNNLVKITKTLARELITQQFPQWAHLLIEPITVNGVDNRTFRLGNEMSIRLPRAAGYAAQVPKEQKWLPLLAPHLSLTIPKPLTMGNPSKNYPWHWSVYRWVEGENPNTLFMNDEHLQQVGVKLALFLNELHKIDIIDGPLPGLHNYWRGSHPSVYDIETRSAIRELEDFIDARRAICVWEKAISSKWNKDPVWIHGDISIGNILVKDHKLVAIIDFGCIGVGDPACDLVIAWTFLKNESRKTFRSHLCLDPDTWLRAQGWALWKALITIAQEKDKSSFEVLKQQHIINEILNEHEF